MSEAEIWFGSYRRRLECFGQTQGLYTDSERGQVFCKDMYFILQEVRSRQPFVSRRTPQTDFCLKITGVSGKIGDKNDKEVSQENVAMGQLTSFKTQNLDSESRDGKETLINEIQLTFLTYIN